MNEERRRRLLGISVGVSDEALKRIGLLMVLGAGLDYRRMTLLERAGDVPVHESAKWPRKVLTRAIADVYSRPPFDPLSARVERWQAEVLELLGRRDRYAHSITYYQLSGDGAAGSISEHPRTGQVTAVVHEPGLDDEVLRFSDAGSAGAALEIETTVLREGGVKAHQEHLRAHQKYERAVEKMFRDPPPT